MKKIFIYMTLFISIIFLTSHVDILKAEDLIIYTEENAPLNFTNADGKVDGFATEIVKEIQKVIGSNDPILMASWKRGYREVTNETEKNIALFSTTFTEERRNLFKWVGPVGNNSWVFYATSDSNISINSLEDAKKVTSIGTYFDDVREQYLKAHGFTNLESVLKPELNLLKLLNNRINLWITSEIGAQAVCEKAGIKYEQIKPVYTFERVGLYIAFHKNTSDDIVNKWKNGYNQIKKNGTLAKIAQKWNMRIPEHRIQ
ncbi:MAG: ABC transporter substrate-binding protein [Desulfobacterales bacterium]|nr:ABC transporter substrate-binding protein [Desulfobacterales bacterium]